MTIQERIKQKIHSCKEILPEDSMKEVLHFFEHDEYEMAFEGLVLELINLRLTPRNFDYDDWREVMKMLRLDEESVLDTEIWNKFEEWGKGASN